MKISITITNPRILGITLDCSYDKFNISNICSAKRRNTGQKNDLYWPGHIATKPRSAFLIMLSVIFERFSNTDSAVF